jgi:integrase/recombinase XerD
MGMYAQKGEAGKTKSKKKSHNHQKEPFEMPTGLRLLQTDIDTYLEILEKENRSIRTLGTYRYELNRIFNALYSEGLTVNPEDIKEKEINYLRREFLEGSPRYVRFRIAIVGSFLKWKGNNIVERMRISWPNDMRINADWLTDEQAVELKKRAIQPGIQSIIIALELGMGLRRIEIIRLKIKDINENTIEVLGKGRNGGKLRTIPIQGYMKERINSWIVERNKIISKAKAINPHVKIPDSLLIYERNGRIGSYKKTAIDKKLKDVAREFQTKYGSDFHFSNHTLRRTFGRMAWRKGIEIETIAHILGHENTIQTKKYLGINFDDMSRAFDKLDEEMRVRA